MLSFVPLGGSHHRRWRGASHPSAVTDIVAGRQLALQRSRRLTIRVWRSVSGNWKASPHRVCSRAISQHRRGIAVVGWWSTLRDRGIRRCDPARSPSQICSLSVLAQVVTSCRPQRAISADASASERGRPIVGGSGRPCRTFGGLRSLAASAGGAQHHPNFAGLEATMRSGGRS